jgi:hypothetical protein
MNTPFFPGGRFVAKEITRKQFLQKLFVVGAAMLAAGTRDADAQTTPATEALPCGNLDGLSENDLKMRNEILKYVQQSSDPKKLCENCKFWVPPTCGTCTLVKGPIAPKGYCASWFTAEE